MGLVVLGLVAGMQGRGAEVVRLGLSCFRKGEEILKLTWVVRRTAEVDKKSLGAALTENIERGAGLFLKRDMWAPEEYASQCGNRSEVLWGPRGGMGFVVLGLVAEMQGRGAEMVRLGLSCFRKGEEILKLTWVVRRTAKVDKKSLGAALTENIERGAGLFLKRDMWAQKEYASRAVG
ncbi:hypothetical protein F0562_025381 [Nyssa sinensis]|uniref:Uncharacterized protein n=1 Tax=Nyssa sinensis TaxID=561372 RepID=A0A5J5BFH9_9ASTE|nr:hypothetical protein F0562_025381 [Nyssa sinensis]